MTIQPPATTAQNQISNDVAMVASIASVPTVLQAVAHLTGLRFAAVARVTDTGWTACAIHDDIDFGLELGGQLELSTTICNEIRQHRQPVVFNQASIHPQFATHPVPKLYGFESYVSIPIFLEDGRFFGTLCALDPLPAKLDVPDVMKTLELFARLIGAELDSAERLARTASALLDAQETAVLREQFIAVLGHDLRSPLGATRIGADLLESMELGERPARIIGHIQRSCDRMGEMIENILDFARGRLGSGIPVSVESHDNLAGALQQVIEEVRAAYPERTLQVAMDITEPVHADAGRLAQLLANLLNNAMVHGSEDEPVAVSATTKGKAFELCVRNGGEPIPPDKIDRLFRPFTRGDDAHPQTGLGLGLYIAAEVAKAHGGTLDVTSTEADGTCFTFRLPDNAV